MVAVHIDRVVFWIGIIQSINSYTLSTGNKSMNVTARSRDATPAWRDMRRVTDVYTIGTELDLIVRNVLYGMGLLDPEMDIPPLSMQIVQCNMQLSDLPPWQMLTVLLQPAGFEPYVDTLGRVKAIQRSVTRTPDIALTDNTRLISVQGSKSKPSVTEVRLKWIDPNLSLVDQVDRSLFSASITAGFFQLRQRKDVYFSADQSQRARDTRLVIRQSANSGLLPVCSEEYEQFTPTTGRISLETALWVPALATGAMLVKLNAHLTPDGVVSFGGGSTIPIGRVYEFAADAVLFITMMSLGTGHYEIWGTPYDSVHALNTTTAYNEAASVWETNVLEIQNDLVMDEAGAQAFAIRELIYATRSTSSYGITMVDDLRVEKGDIISLSDDSRLYVTDYRRDLTFGSPATLEIQGFRC